jgi:F-type H+-transporting ATPase subunit epsilon
MNLKVLLPTEVLVDEEVTKVVAEAHNGSFCLLPKHVDFTAALAPGLLAFETAEDQEVFLALDEGVLVKYGSTVLVSTRQGVRGEDLAELKRMVEDQFKVLDDREKTARSAVAKIEASFVRRFLDIQKHV